MKFVISETDEILVSHSGLVLAGSFPLPRSLLRSY
jgi:hypothetical protein